MVYVVDKLCMHNYVAYFTLITSVTIYFFQEHTLHMALHEKLADEIDRLCQVGITDATTIKRNLEVFTQSNFPGEGRWNRRYYPTVETVRNNIKRWKTHHITNCDQERLEERIKEWRKERPEAKFHYRPRSDEKSFLFIHQNKNQKNLLGRYTFTKVLVMHTAVSHIN